MPNTIMPNTINSPLAQSAKMYSLLEAELRRATANSISLTIQELRAIPEVKATEKSNWQVRDVINTFLRHENLIVITRADTKVKTKWYCWDLNSAPFLLDLKHRNSRKQASKVVISKPVTKIVPTSSKQFPEGENYEQAEVAPTRAKKPDSHEIELVFEGIQIVIGRNKETGRIRIVIE